MVQTVDGRHGHGGQFRQIRDIAGSNPEGIRVPYQHETVEVLHSGGWSIARVQLNSPLEVVATILAGPAGLSAPVAGLLMFVSKFPEWRSRWSAARTESERQNLHREILRQQLSYLRDRGVEDDQIRGAVIQQMNNATGAMLSISGVKQLA